MCLRPKPATQIVLAAAFRPGRAVVRSRYSSARCTWHRADVCVRAAALDEVTPVRSEPVFRGVVDGVAGHSLDNGPGDAPGLGVDGEAVLVEDSRLNGGVPPTDVALWASQSVEIMFRIYAKYLDRGPRIAASPSRPGSGLLGQACPNLQAEQAFEVALPAARMLGAETRCGYACTSSGLPAFRRGMTYRPMSR